MIIIIISSRAAEDWGLMVCLAPLKLQYLMCVCMHAKSLRLGLTLCNPMDCSPPSSSVHGILQARILEWVAISFSRESTQGLNPCLLHLLHWQADYQLSHWGSPKGSPLPTQKTRRRDDR